jgi:polyhydroxyalkanoate synthesis regulator phasin
MPVKLSTTLEKIDKIENSQNRFLVQQYHKFMDSTGASERHQNNNLKVILSFVNYLGREPYLPHIRTCESILSFLETKKKSKDEDPDQKWISTWNHYFHRIKHFYRWYYNCGFKLLETNPNESQIEQIFYENENQENWKSPDFLQNIKEKKTKRLSPYVENELWQKEELLSIIKYESFKRNKAILSLLWDLNARPHEITLLKIKHIRLKDKYAEGEVPHEAKTGSGPILLTFSFPYVRDWLNEHPFRNEPNARLICNLLNGAPIKSDAIWKVMAQLKTRIIRLLEKGEITNDNEKDYLNFLLSTKKWNPYCIRHSSITDDSDFLPEYALKKKVRWSMNSIQSSRYIKRRMGEQLKKEILVRNGILSAEESRDKPVIINCPRCSLVNQHENKYCSKCSYPLNLEAYDEIKENEERRISIVEQKYEIAIQSLREEMDHKLNTMLSLIGDNPKLVNVKRDVLEKIISK